MISDPNLIRYACVGQLGGGESTILAEYNPGDSSVQELAQECLLRTPPNHAIFSHTVQSCAYTFVIEDPFVYFAIFDEELPKSDRLWFLNRLKDATQRLIVKHSKSMAKSNRSFTSYCLQSQLDPIFHQLMSTSGVDGFVDSDSGVNGLRLNGDDHLSGVACKGQSKGRRIFAVPLLVKMGEGKKKKKRLVGESGGESKEMLVEDKAELSDQDEVTSGEVLVCHEKRVCGGDGGDGGGGLCSGDVAAGGKQRTKKIWRRHVWVVLVLDLAVCLILFGVWLMVCHGFQCIDG